MLVYFFSELYYENVLKFRNQSEIDRAMHDICHLLQAPVWQLRVSGAAKGLIAGPIVFEFADEVITVDSSSGTFSYFIWLLILIGFRNNYSPKCDRY